ncbi:GlxA family transcriptional regulator [Actinokineospora auranticolor]|uniref:Transcriptional regulator GlxA family with amidase domain n=1 Tax=Actinokineospora auranticolor TaxID=155976 RepID=A0A2S6GEG7_9PSEU|nr:GlxA family transcriptional regulator [Actinokineospora auranticolor]PPK63623.1 transcriptional regulator GlxA family with amidase domain [Actinokineospora auranticolor]
MRTVLVLLFEGVQGLDATGPMDVFAGANTRLERTGHAPGYDVVTASLGGMPVTAANGLRLLPDRDLAIAPRPDVLVVPGGIIPDPEHSDEHARLIRWLAAHAPGVPRLVSVCTGAFLLADAGLLAGRRATTHWAYCAQLARRHPDIAVDPEPIFVRDGHVATSAGVTAGIDLALALVEDDHGRDVALAIARHLVVFLRRPGDQAQFSAHLAAQVATRQPLRELQSWIAEHPDADLSVPALAGRCGLSPRHFARAFAREVGVAPGRYVDQVRLEAARLRLQDSADSVERVARACGYGSTEAMRRAFQRALSVGPAEYRRRFTSTVEVTG